MSSQRKPSIVFVHGLWADGSCFSKLIPTLQKEAFEVIASQHGLDSHAGDVDCVKRTLGRGFRFHKLLGLPEFLACLLSCHCSSPFPRR